MNRDGIRAGVAVAALLMSITTPLATAQVANAQVARPAAPPVSPLGGEGYTPVLPARLLDTRPGLATVDGLEAGGGIVGAGDTVDVTVLGRGGVPLTGVDSVVLHVTAVKQTVMGFVTVFPSGEARPTVSSLNPVPGAVSSNLVAVHVGSNGKVSLFNSAGTTHLIVDVEGWFPVGPTFHGVTPARLLDTRDSGTKVGPGGVLDLQVTGAGGVPAGTTSVALNVTVVGATTSTFVTVYPTGTALPATSNLNAQPGIIAANLVIGELSPVGKVRLYNANGSVHLIVDVMGYFGNGPGYTPIYPARVIDTRGGSPLGPNSTTVFHLTGIGGVPISGVGAVAFNLTATHQTARTYLTVYPHGSSQPLSSDLNPQPGVVAPNLVFGKVGPDGSLSVYNSSGTVDVIIDVVGWFPSNTEVLDDSATFTEDDPAATIDVLANDTDYDGGPVLIDYITPPAHGTVVVVADTSVTYEPDADYCNSDTGTPDTFTYTLNGGATGTVSVDVTCVDDLPVAVADDATVAEDAAPTAIDVLANDTDVDGGAKTIASVTQPGDGAVVITGGGTGVTYEPPADYCNSVAGPTTTFTYTLNGGSVATVTVTVTCVDDGPNAFDDSATITEDDSDVAIDVLSNDTDVDAGPKTVASVTQPANGSVAITGGGTGLSYTPDADYCNNPPGTVLDTLTYTVNLGSTATVTVTVDCVDDTPVAVIDHLILSEDSGETPTDVLANDVDVDGGPRLVTSVTQPANGTAAVVGSGTGVSYTPDANYCNSVSGPDDTFSYTLDGGSQAAVTVSVTCVDDAPVAVDDGAIVAEDASATAIDVLGNDTDIDGGPKTIASVTQPGDGAVVITGGGTGLTYQPDANYCNSVAGPSDSFAYSLNGGSTATVTVTVTCADDPPVAVADSTTVTEDDPATAVDVLGNDTDVDGGPKSVASVTQPAHGTVVITGGGTGVTYEPMANYCNDGVGGDPDTFDYTLNGGSTATVSVTVSCVDDAPIAVADAATLAEDDPATAIAVLLNDTDIDVGPMTVASVTQPAHGSVVITGGGTGLTYEPDADYCNSVSGPDDSFTYTLTPGVSTTTVTVTVTCVDDAPIAVADSATVTEDSGANAVDVLANDTDIDAGPKTVASVTQPANGTVVITGGGTGVDYTPVANACNNPPGTVLDTFTYTLNGGSSATVTVTVDCVDDAPLAVGDAATLTEDDPATAVDVLANDTDVDGGPKSIASVTQPAHGTVVITGGGTGVTYQPAANYCNSQIGGTADTFTYTLSPGGATGTVSVSVNCVNDVPVAVADALTIVEDATSVLIPALANDVDVDGDPIVFETLIQPMYGTASLGAVDISYIPPADFCGDAQMAYTINGGSFATVTVHVTCVDDLPNAADDTIYMNEDVPATAFPVLANDPDVDGGPKAIASVTQPANGTVVITGGGTGLTYEPDADYCNSHVGDPTDTFTYTLTPAGTTPTATVSATVVCVDDAPTAVADSATVAEDGGATAIDVLANDTDIDGGLKMILPVTQPSHGTVVITGGGTGVTYEPALNYCNSVSGIDDSFTYTINGGSSATVTVTVTCVDDAAQAVTDTATVTQNDQATAIDVLANDVDVDGGASYSIVSASQPANGTVVITGGGTGLTYQPDFDYCNDSGPTTDDFSYTITGGSAGAVQVTVICLDDPPTAVADNATVSEDSGANPFPVLANDTDADGGPISIASVTQPANGTVVITGGGTGLTYEPNANYCNNPPGSTLDTFSYTLTPGSSTATVTVTVTCVDDAPTAVADSATVSEDDPATAISVLTNDTDVDGGAKTIASVTQPAHGTVIITGGGTGLTYQPNANYCNNPPGSTLDTFTYTLTPGGSSTTVTVTVTCVDDAPTAVADAATVTEDDPATAINVLVNDTDVDGGAKSVASVTQPANGAVVITGGGTGLTYQPNANYCNNPPGSTLDRFTYMLTPGSSSTTVTLTVTCVDDPPTAVGDIASVAEDALATTIPVMTNDSDIDAGPRSIASVTQPANGTVVITGGGTGLTYKPAANYCNDQAPASTDDFTYTLTPGSSSATVAMTVTCVNDAPTAIAPTYSAVANMSISVSAVDGVLAGAADTEGTTLTVSNLSAPSVAGSTLTLDTATGSFDLAPKPGYTGAITFSYKVCDAGTPLPSACTTTITATVNVGGPVIWFVDDSAVAGGDGTLSKPFQTLTAAATAASASQHIFVFSGTYSTGVTLKSGGWLIGQPTTGSTFDALFGLGSTLFVQARPTLATGSVTIGGEVALGTNSKVRGVAINSPGKGLSGSSITGVDVDQTSIGNTSSTGPALDLNTVAGTLLLSNVSQTGGATGISIASSTASVTVQAGTISSTTSKAIVLTGGSNTISLPAGMTVTVSAGRALEVSGRTGGTLTIPGSFTATGGTGISLTSNTGATINLTGVLNLSTGAGDAFTATGGGTVTATDATNVLATTTGTALNVANTTIGASGLKFKSISAGTGATGPASGIILNTTGSAGSLTVLGAGSASSGGTIQHTTGAGISLTSTTGPSFTRMHINNTTGSGIRGTGVVGFSLTNSTIDTSGSTGAADTSNIAFNSSALGTESNLSGAVTITGNTLNNAAWHGVDILNFNGTVSSANISNNNLTSNTSGVLSLGSGIRLQALGSAATVANVTAATINTNTITNFPSGGGILAQGGNTNAGGSAGVFGTPSSANKITMTGNTISGQTPAARMGTSAISATVNGRGVANFAIDNNQLSNTTGQTLLLGANGITTAEYLVTNNTIVANNTVGSPGIGIGTGVTFGTTDTATITATITGNNISQTDGNGILAVARGATGTLKVKIQNNTVAAPLTGVRPGIRVDAGNTPSVNDTVCLNISGNTSAGSGGSQGIGLRKQGTVPTTNAFGINGMAATASPGVETYVSGLNPSGNGTLLISATSGFTNCSLP